MSLKSSGLWCDLCGKPILTGEYWDIGVTNNKTGEFKKGHSCNKCQKEWQKQEPTPTEEKE